MICRLDAVDSQYVLAWFGRAPAAVIAEALGVPELWVWLTMRDRGRLRSVQIRDGLPWTTGELGMLRREYPHCDTYEMACRLRRSQDSVRHRARRLGIRKAHDYRSMERRMERLQSFRPGDRNAVSSSGQ